MRPGRDDIERLITSRARLPHADAPVRKASEEGGCGVTGFISSVPVKGRHIFTPSVQMHNRGNGKGGGIAAVGLCPEDLGVRQEVLDTHYLLQIALLDPACRPELERFGIEPSLEVSVAGRIPTLEDHREVDGLEVRPPDVWRYFIRAKAGALDRFIEENGLQNVTPREAEDELIYQNSYRINHRFYASLGSKQAFVLSHGRDIMVLKIVGYAEQVAQYYLLENVRAHGWIAHQRYPTKGRVWHPGGAHPFIGLNEALVHNGDFANYHSVCEYLGQHSIFPQFLTDTEVSVLLFDLWSRVYRYPLEYLIEALAPTGEHDFDLLPPEKQRIYRYLQASHVHSSPDGPWFFIIARNDPQQDCLQLIGVTDTSMLRPQVFALQEGKVQIGLVCSEKQAIDATLRSLAAEDSRFCPVADRYWNARGGSATDGGAFVFTVRKTDRETSRRELLCTNKFGGTVSTPTGQRHLQSPVARPGPPQAETISRVVRRSLSAGAVSELKEHARQELAAWSFGELVHFCQELVNGARTDPARAAAIEVLTYLHDGRFSTGHKKRSSVIHIVSEHLERVFGCLPTLGERSDSRYRRIDLETRDTLRAPGENETVLVLNAAGFPPEGDGCDARLLCDAHRLGWRRFICYGYTGQRFCGCGLSPDSQGTRIDVYGSSGDYLASGIDGLEIVVHGDAQDQAGQIMKRGRLVVHGDVGQTFMYGAKGGEVYVLGNAAGRPLINAVGRPRVVINGTCLDYLAESFMAGDPLNGGGFVIMNGVEFDQEGNVVDQATPYPGSNLFSLASGGAIYLRDPHRSVAPEQLNGGEFVSLEPADWDLVLPYLRENERLFGISVEDNLLTVGGQRKGYQEVYRKVQAVALDVLRRIELDAEED